MGRVCETQEERGPLLHRSTVGEEQQLVPWRESRFGGQLSWVQILAFMSCGPRPGHFITLSLSFLIHKRRWHHFPEGWLGVSK